MNKSIEILDELSFQVFISSRIPPKELICKHLDKIPKALRQRLQDVKSEELALTRLDHIFPKSKDAT